MLIDRLRTSGILIAAIVIFLWADVNHSRVHSEGLWLMPVLLFFAAGTAWDIADLLKQGGVCVTRRACGIIAMAVAASAAVPQVWPLIAEVFQTTSPHYPEDFPAGRMGWPLMALLAGVGVLFLVEMIRYPSDAKDVIDLNQVLQRISGGVFAVTIAGLPIAVLFATRDLGEKNWGLAAVLTVIATTKCGDAGAYFVGRACGRHKLVPKLSPGKTIEGALGGIVAAGLAAWPCLRMLFPMLDVPESSVPASAWAWLLGPMLAISGMFGDLAESLVKRLCGAKDSGTLLPGLGGVWDVTDSLIAASVPGYLAFSVIAGTSGI